MTYRLRNILIAVVLALFAALLTSFYVTNYQRNVDKDKEKVPVFVAVRDIPPGTPGDDVLASLKETQVPRENLSPGAVAEKSDVHGKVSTQWIYQDEQVTLRRFVDQRAGGVRAEIKGTQRAFQIAGDAQQVLAGTLKKGDHVDLVATFGYKAGSNNSNTHSASRIVLRDLIVLNPPRGPAAGSKLTSGLNDRFPVMLKVTDAQAPKLSFVMPNAESGNNVIAWHLILRPVTKPEDSPESVQTLDTILLDGLSPRQRALLFGKFGGQ
jgi:Flp pilus assembly protein CpaB